MKKRRLALLGFAAVFLLGLRVFAAGGTSGDPLITLSYLNGTFRSKLQTMMTEWAREDTQPLIEEAISQVDQLGESYLSGSAEGEWSYSAYYEQLKLKRGDKLVLSTGSGMFWMNGRGYTASGMVDITTGTEPAEKTECVANHRYLAVEESEVGIAITVISDAATVSVEGHWNVIESDETVTNFTDLTKSKDWFYQSVAYVVDKGLFNGISEDQFAPLSSMNRSMLAVVLHRMAGKPDAEYSGTFPDVKAGTWYTEGVEWAKANGIVNGSSDGTFRPSARITRQEIALMLYRYAGNYLGLDVNQRGSLDRFSDSESISNWAKEGVSWAVGAGIVTGSDTGKINPQKNASRAEVATMLQRLEKWIQGAESAG